MKIDESKIEESVRNILQGYMNIINTDSAEVSIADYLLLRKQVIYEHQLFAHNEDYAAQEPNNIVLMGKAPKYVRKPEYPKTSETVSVQNGSSSLDRAPAAALLTEDAISELDILNSIED